MEKKLMVGSGIAGAMLLVVGFTIRGINKKKSKTEVKAEVVEVKNDVTETIEVKAEEIKEKEVVK